MTQWHKLIRPHPRSWLDAEVSLVFDSIDYYQPDTYGKDRSFRIYEIKFSGDISGWTLLRRWGLEDGKLRHVEHTYASFEDAMKGLLKVMRFFQRFPIESRYFMRIPKVRGSKSLKKDMESFFDDME